MYRVEGYEIGERLTGSGPTALFRGRATTTGEAVLLRLVESQHMGSRSTRQLRREHEIGTGLDCDTIIRPIRLLSGQPAPALVLADPGGRPLSALPRPLDRAAFLDVAIALAEALAPLHAARVIHKNIEPDSIFIDPTDRRAWLGGLGIATRLSHETQEVADPGGLEGRLAYISPEQTGRMNRSIDYRTDLYSLGVVLFELLTGSLPLQAHDAMGWVHAHIARRPIHPAELDVDVPQALSEIVLKLLAKNAEDRYQSALGLRHDLLTCRAMLEEHGGIGAVEIGRHDVSDRFTLPERLYGRGAEIDALLGAFGQAAAGARVMVVVSGPSGIGKSALIRELHRPVVERRGLLAAGKSDQFKRDLPYQALLQAMRDVVRQVLTQPQERVERWGRALAEALEGNGRIITDVIPEVEILVGPQPPVPDLRGAEARHRFQLAFQRFVGVFAQDEHPLVVFLDDLQWIDADSMDLIEAMIASNATRNLLLIGATRPQGLEAGHHVATALDRLREGGAPVHDLEVGPLGPGAIGALVADTIDERPAAVVMLASLVHDRTGGNPFFAGQLLRTLHRDGYIRHDNEAGRWTWNLDHIGAAAITDDVVQLMADGLGRLPASASDALQVAASLGSRFSVDAVALVRGTTLSQTTLDLWPALEEGLVEPTAGGQHLLGTRDVPVADGDADLTFRFVHDRIQEAAYGLVEPAERVRRHGEIGRIMLSHAVGPELDERLFEIVGHLNIAAPTLTAPAERRRLAELDLRAGRRAMASSAFGPARALLSTALSLLAEDAWQSDHALALAVHIAASEAHLVTGDMDTAQRLAATIIARAADIMDRVPAYELRIHVLNNQFRLRDAVEEALSVSALLGFPVELPTSPEDFPRRLGGVFEAIGGRPVEELALLPDTDDPRAEAAVRILTTTLPSAGMGAPELYPFMVFDAMGILLRHGLTPYAPSTFGSFGVLLSIIGQYDVAWGMGDLAWGFRERFASTGGNTEALLDFPTFTRHWKSPVRESAEMLTRSAITCLNLGNLSTWGYCTNQAYSYAFMAGERLPTLDARYADTRTALLERGQALAVMGLEPFAQAVSNLLGRADNPARLAGDRFDEATAYDGMADNQFFVGTNIALGASEMLGVVFGDPAHVIELSARWREKVGVGPNLAMFVYTWHFFYPSLAKLALMTQADEQTATRWRAEIAADQERLAVWAAAAPANHAHRHLLVRCEIARVEGRQADALQGYDEAAHLAREQGLLHDVALAFELAAGFHRGQGRELVARAYAEQAVGAWAEWGATAKVAHVRSQYAPLRPSDRGETATATPTQAMDLDSVTRISQAISGEIRLDRLLASVMRIVVQNAGAVRGWLLLQDTAGLGLYATGTADEVEVRDGTPVEDVAELPQSIVQYVVRTRSDVVLADACHEGIFNGDPAVVRLGLRSVACLPLVRQARLSGILFLENSLTAGAFTEDRAELLRILSAQAATSIDNARLYTDLQSYSEELERKNVRLTELDRVRDEFMANTSHELRTPLNGIIGIAQSLIDGAGGELPEAARRNLSLVVSSGRRLSNLVNDVLDFSTLKNRTIKLRRAAVDLPGIASMVLSLSEPLVGGKPLLLHNNIPVDLPRVHADEERLEQILHNLIGNAIKFTETGEVELTAEVEGDHVIVRVRDTGIGIRREVQERIFNAFEQADGSTARLFGGTGLGLAVSRQIVELHGGDIGVVSAPGKGSTFWFTLPVASATVARSAARAPSERAIAAPTELLNLDRADLDEEAITVMVVDDEPVNLQVLINQLGRLGFRVLTAVSGQEALARIETGRRPDIVVLDIMMPTMSGIEVCQKLRERYSSADLPIIMLTARSRSADVVTGLETGANDYVTKPFSAAELVARIRTHLQLSRVNHAIGRFVPMDFLRLLGRESLVDVQLGDNIERDMSVLFSDIRSFTTLSETMTPEENFRFINDYLGQMEPVVVEHHGFIDKYIGDAIMALFDQDADDAVQAGIGMLMRLRVINQARLDRDQDPIRIGIGINTGRLRLGTVGGPHHMNSTVVSDAVNLASRTEGLTKRYNAGLMITEFTYARLAEPGAYAIRVLDRVMVKGKNEPVTVYEVYDADSPALREMKDATRSAFEDAVRHFHEREFSQAQRLFERCLALHPGEVAAQQYLERCRKIHAQFMGMSF